MNDIYKNGIDINLLQPGQEQEREDEFSNSVAKEEIKAQERPMENFLDQSFYEPKTEQIRPHSEEVKIIGFKSFND